MTHVLFVCVANSGRSLMAERIFRSVAGDRHETRSAIRLRPLFATHTKSTCVTQAPAS